MGTGLVYHLGQLEYVDSTSSSPTLNTSLLVYLAGGLGGAILAIVFIVIVLFMRKSRQSARAVKRMRSQIDVLEARVAKECKEGDKTLDVLFILHSDTFFIYSHCIVCLHYYYYIVSFNLWAPAGFFPVVGRLGSL